MKFVIAISLTTTLAGCTWQNVTLSTLDGIQRVPINKQVETMGASEAAINQQESNHVRK